MTVLNPPTWLQGGSHSAQGDRNLIAKLTGDREGILGVDDLEVEQQTSANMSVKVDTGTVLVKGTESTYQGTYLCENQGSTTVTIAASDASNDRIDLIVARVYDSQYGTAVTDEWDLEVVTGTAAASPVFPTVPDNSYVLARVDVGASVTSILTADIIDMRAGLSSDGVTTLGNKGFAAAIGGIIVCTSASRPDGVEGLSIYESDTDREYSYNGTAWRQTSGPPSTNYARISRDGSDQAIVTSTYTQVDLLTERVMPTGWSSSSGAITVPEAGMYFLTASIRWASNATGQRITALYINGSLADDGVRPTVINYPGIAGAFTQNVSNIANLAAGDTVAVYVYQTSGGNLNVEEVQDYSHLTVARVG